MGKRKELSKFSDLELIEELRVRGNALTVYGSEYLENVGVKPKDCRKEFDEIREDLEDHMAFEANRWLDNKFKGYLDKMLKKLDKEGK